MIAYYLMINVQPNSVADFFIFYVDLVLFGQNNDLKLFNKSNSNHIVWYRMFEEDTDALTNIWIAYPSYYPLDSLYSFTHYKIEPSLHAEDNHHFKLLLSQTPSFDHPLVLMGQSDRPIVAGQIIYDAVLHKGVFDDGGEIDRFAHCERTVLEEAILEGKHRYQLYIDAI